MSHPIRIGLKVSGQAATAGQLRSCWRIADEVGFDHLWNFDHLAGIKSSGEGSGIFDAWSLLAVMAEATRRIRIGCLVTGNTYRHPAVLAKIAATVDHFSNGRLEFGIGAAWSQSEHVMNGIDGLDHRVGRLSESLQVLKMLWTQERTSFDGRYYTFREAVANPKPIQKPHPPIWVGARGETTLKLVARFADVWNVAAPQGNAAGVQNARDAGRLGEQLREECERIGRPPDQVRWSCQIFWDGIDRPRLTDAVGAFLAEGFTEVVVFPDVRASTTDLVVAVAAAADELPNLRRLST